MPAAIATPGRKRSNGAGNGAGRGLTPYTRERLLEEHWFLQNSFGWGAFRDGLVRERIAVLEERLAIGVGEIAAAGAVRPPAAYLGETEKA